MVTEHLPKITIRLISDYCGQFSCGSAALRKFGANIDRERKTTNNCRSTNEFVGTCIPIRGEISP